MSKIADIIQAAAPANESVARQMERFFDTAHANSVFTSPVTQGDYTAVMAAEVLVGAGFGYGIGGSEGIVAESSGEGETVGNAGPMPGAGGGGGGGGGSIVARPVAAIEIGPRGVEVKPIIDPTKVMLAFLTTLGAMFMFLGRMNKQAREWEE